MFFSRKTDKSLPLLVEILADYYSLAAEDTQSWCEVKEQRAIVTLPFCAQSQHEALQQHIVRKLAANDVQLEVSVQQRIKTFATKIEPVKNVRNIVAVASGKGGVGKSATAINLAFALSQEGAKVGILDADIYGPSIPIMMGNAGERPESSDNKHMQPLQAWGIVANSIGYLVEQEEAAVWRGPMASRALKQLLDETLWPVLDYLIVDMPPGTGDIQLTMAQQVPLTGALIVTTPQDLALADAQKGISMFGKVDVPVLGLIENMSYYQCQNCGMKDYIFSHDGGKALAERYNLPLLGALPLDVRIREHADSGQPLLISEPDSPLAQSYRDTARALSMQMAFTLEPASNENHIKGDPIGIRLS